MALLLDDNDYNISNFSSVIPVGESQYCFQLVAVDDTIVESDEEFILVVETKNSNDIVSGNVTVVIFDNDSKGEFYSLINRYILLINASLHSCEP